MLEVSSTSHHHVAGMNNEASQELEDISFVSLDEKSTLYTLITELLSARGRQWQRRTNIKGKFNLLFAKVHGVDVPYELLGQDGQKHAVNYYRGCQVLTRKAETHR